MAPGVVVERLGCFRIFSLPVLFFFLLFGQGRAPLHFLVHNVDGGSFVVGVWGILRQQPHRVDDPLEAYPVGIPAGLVVWVHFTALVFRWRGPLAQRVDLAIRFGREDKAAVGAEHQEPFVVAVSLCAFGVVVW